MHYELICTAITTAGVLASAGVSWNVARMVAKREFQKLKMEWERQDVVESNKRFSEMVAAVSLYTSKLSDGYSVEPHEAISMLSSVRSVETGAIAETLDHLYFALKDGTIQEVNEALSKAVDQKRRDKNNVNGKKN